MEKGPNIFLAWLSAHRLTAAAGLFCALLGVLIFWLYGLPGEAIVYLIGLCLVGVIIGEFIGARQGLGYLIIYGSQVFKLDWVILSIVILCIIAIILYGILGLIEKRTHR